MDYKLNAFEMRFWKELRRLEQAGTKLSKTKILVAVSGGRDSCVLLELLLRVQSRLEFEIVVAHMHHGLELDQSASKWGKSSIREGFCKHVAGLAAEKGLEFVCNVPTRARGFDWQAFYADDLKLKSEADLRRHRMQQLHQWQTKMNADWIVFAHHADDLFETRMIRLIRGTGPEGLVGMRQANGKKLRPLLFFSAHELAEYANSRRLKWIEDPSNQDVTPLRNWLRRKWIPNLDKKRRGASQSFARSLETLVDVWEMRVPQLQFVRLDPGILHRPSFSLLVESQQLVILAQLLLEMNVRSFTRLHLQEIAKRLCNEQREFQFRVAQVEWHINAQQIQALPLPSQNGEV